MRQTTDRILSAVEIVAMSTALISLFLIMVSISADAFARYFLSAPIQGQYEFTSLYLMVLLTFMGLARTQALGGHVAISVLDPVLRRVPYMAPARLTALICAATFAYFTWLTGEAAIDRIVARTTTFGLVQFPTYLSYCWLPVGTGILTLRLLHQTFWPVSKKPAPDDMPLE